MRALGIIDESAALSPRDPSVPSWEETGDQELQDLKMAIYAAQVGVMDRGVGRVLSKLKAMGQEDNTLVLFLADHGACARRLPRRARGRFNRPPYLGGRDSFATYGTAWANVGTTPRRKFKTYLEEGGISIPMIAVWPGSIAKPGGLCHDLGHQIDLMPTILEITGSRVPAAIPRAGGATLDGSQLRPAAPRRPQGVTASDLLGIRRQAGDARRRMEIDCG